MAVAAQMRGNARSESGATAWPQLDRELFANQFWELIAFIAKATFFFLLTPRMIRQWGESGYGLFAVAGSLFIFLGLLDLGVRPRVRIALAHEDATGRRENFRAILKKGILAQLTVMLPALALIGLLASLSSWESWLHLASGGNFIIFLSAICSAAFLISALFLEPLMACGFIGLAKKSSACAAVAAVPVVWILLRQDCSIALALVAWFGCMIAGNLAGLFLARHILPKGRLPFHGRFKLRDGLYFNASTLSWLAKTHLLTLIVAAIGGAAEAGFFFVLLRLSEMVSNFGAMSADAALSALAQARGAGERRRRFANIASYALFFSLQAALGLALVAPTFLRTWWPALAPLPGITGIFVALFGLSMALNRIVSSAAFGLGLTTSVAGAGLLDGAIGIFAALLLHPIMGVNGILLGSALGSFGQFILIRQTLAKISSRALAAIGWEARRLAPWLVISVMVLLLGRVAHNPSILLASAGLVGLLSLEWVRQHLAGVRKRNPATEAQTASVYSAERPSWSISR